MAYQQRDKKGKWLIFYLTYRTILLYILSTVLSGVYFEYEKKQGRKSKDVSTDKLFGYDIKSGRRCIEVKGMSHKTGAILNFIKNY